MTTALRRAPSQDRSRERVETILARAADIIAERGSDAMRMAEVAQRANISIGSLYQYFPDKGAVVRALADRYNAIGRACIEDGLATVRTMAALRRSFAALFDAYYAQFLAEPVMRDIWSGMQVERGLREVELDDNRANGRVLAGALARVRPDDDRAQQSLVAFLIMQLGAATVRLAVSVPRAEGDALVRAYTRMALTELGRRR